VPVCAQRRQSPCLNINYKMFAPIQGFSNYRVCDLGYIVKYPSLVKVPVINSRFILSGRARYEACQMRADDGHFGQKLIHRMVAEAFIENKNGFKHVDHIDGDRSNNSIKNLRWVTSHQNNCNRSVRCGIYLRGVSKIGRRYYVNWGKTYGKGISFETYLEAAKFRLNWEKETGEYFRDQIPEKVTLEILNEIIDGF